MAEIKAMHRTLKSQEENERDFYITPTACTKALVDFIQKDLKLSEDLKVLDPCAGELHITEVIKEYFKDVTYIDKFMEYSEEDFFEHKPHYDLIISNIPYSNKYHFLKHSFEKADIVISILPLQIFNYNVFHKEYMNIPEFVGKLILTPKIIMNGENKIKRGGQSSYAWCIWDKNNKESYSKEWYRNLDNFK